VLICSNMMLASSEGNTCDREASKFYVAMQHISLKGS
jgi:hypothetical protein